MTIIEYVVSFKLKILIKPIIALCPVEMID